MTDQRIAMPAKRRKPGVLVVEDEPLVLSFIADAVGAWSETYTARTADEALAFLSVGGTKLCQAALVDCLLPGRSGVELMRQISSTWPLLPMVAMTGVSVADELIISAFRSGARDFLKKPFSVDDLEAALRRLMKRKREGQPSEAHVKMIRPVIEFVREHYTDRLELRDLALRAGLSPSHFSRVFHEVTGAPFTVYIRDLRLTYVQHLLSTSCLSLTQIALEAGFYDLPHLDKVFRTRFSVSPTEYARARHRPRPAKPVPKPRGTAA